MADEISGDVDLFGLPIRRSKGQRGRPPHEATQENIMKVNMLLAFGRTDAEIAAALDITEPTLRKHYFSVLKRKADARLQAEAWLLAKIGEQVSEGNVAAMKELARRFDKFDISLLAERAANRGRDDRGRDDRQKAQPRLGKKDQQKADARSITGKFAPPPPPDRLN